MVNESLAVYKACIIWLQYNFFILKQKYIM